jgi:predicted acetyltransferase
MDSRIARLSLHAIDELEARRIHDRAPQSSDAWAADYPFEGDLAATGSFLRATEQNGEQRPFGYYQIRRQSDGLAVGGVGFKGPPDGGVVEIGFGLAPSARGHGYATEALRTLVQIAAGLGVTTVRAGRRELGPFVDVVVWVQCGQEVADQRSIERVGRPGGSRTISALREWMAEETPFLIEQKPWERARFIVDGAPVIDHDPRTEVVTATPV